MVKRLVFTRKCPLRRHILAPTEGLCAPELPGVNPRSQEVISRPFKRKKIFCDEVRTKYRWTDRREGGNSYVDLTLKEPEYLVCLKAGGGRNPPTDVFVLLYC